VAQPDRDEHWMRRALDLAAAGLGRGAPNPMVGAVLVRGEEVVGEGYHARFGGPHPRATAAGSPPRKAADGCTKFDASLTVFWSGRERLKWTGLGSPFATSSR